MINKDRGRHPYAVEIEDFMQDPKKMKDILGFPLFTTHPSTNGATYSFCDTRFTYDFYDKKNEWYSLTITIKDKKRNSKKGIPYKSRGGKIDWGVFIKQNNLEAIALKNSMS